MTVTLKISEFNFVMLHITFLQFYNYPTKKEEEEGCWLCVEMTRRMLIVCGREEKRRMFIVWRREEKDVDCVEKRREGCWSCGEEKGRMLIVWRREGKDVDCVEKRREGCWSCGEEEWKEEKDDDCVGREEKRRKLCVWDNDITWWCLVREFR